MGISLPSWVRPHWFRLVDPFFVEMYLKGIKLKLKLQKNNYKIADCPQAQISEELQLLHQNLSNLNTTLRSSLDPS